MRTWTHDDTAILRTEYGTATDAQLAKKLRCSVTDIAEKAAELALAKDKRQFPGMLKMPRWSAAEIKTLRRLYPKQSSRDVALELGRSKKSVDSKAQEIGLVKTPSRLVKAGRENVQTRYDRKRTADA